MGTEQSGHQIHGGTQHKESKGQGAGGPEVAWSGHWATWPGHCRSAARGPEAQA